MAHAGGGDGQPQEEGVKEQRKLFTITKFTGTALCCCSNSNAQSPAGTVFWSHTRENEACPVCTKLLSSECVECEEQIELRPGLLFLHFLCAFLSYLTHCFECLILNFPPCFEMHSVSYILMQPTHRNQGELPIV